MKKKSKDKNKAAGFSPTTKLEFKAINVFNYIIDINKCISQVTQNDKTPNIDGNIAVIDDNSNVKGNIEVQIKKMPDKFSGKLCHYFPISLLDYAEKIAFNPVIFVSVDCVNSIAYWHEVSNTALSAYANKMKNESGKFLLKFPPENLITQGNSEYVSGWLEILRKRREKFDDYDSIRNEVVSLRERSDPLLGENKPEFEKIHSFIDGINQLIDGQFSVLKRNLFSNCWKLGISYKGYTKDSIDFGFYPIPYNRNDLQIKQLPNDLLNGPFPKGIRSIHSFLSSNPLIKEAKLQAAKEVKSYVEDLLKYRLLTHAGSEFLAREYLFAFIDKFFIPLGLTEKDQYRIDEIQNAVYVHFPFWIDEAIKYLLESPVPRNFRFIRGPTIIVDPNQLLASLSKEEKRIVEDKVQARMNNKEPKPPVRIANDKFRLEIVIEFLDSFSREPSNEISRVYPKRNFERITSSSGWIWDSYTKDEFGIALRNFYEHFIPTYKVIIDQNFPEIADDLSSLRNVTKMLGLYQFSGEWSLNQLPSFTYSYLHSDEEAGKYSVNILPEDENQHIFGGDLKKMFDPTVTFEGRQYQNVGGGWGVCDYIFGETPMFEKIYEQLQHDLRDYFKNKYNI